MASKITRRSLLKKILGGLLTTGIATSGGYYYARNIEPNLLSITYHTIKHKSLPKEFDNLKIVQFSDTHLGFQYEVEQLEELIIEINNINPDIIIFTGDLLDAPNMYPNTQKVVQLLSKLNSTLGNFAIYGNHDHGGYGSDIYKKVMEASGFTLLLNDSRKINLLNNIGIWMIGIDDAMLGRINFPIAFSDIPEEDFKIVLSHAPDLADDSANFGAHLQFSGHSHGGQIKVPFLGALVTPPFATKYREGFYEIGSLKLYVNRGLGTTRLPFRFLSRPELTVFTLRTEN